MGRSGVLEEPGELTKEVGGERGDGEGLCLGPVVEGQEGGEGGGMGEGTEKERRRRRERRKRRRRGWLDWGEREGREGFQGVAKGEREGERRRREAGEHISSLSQFTTVALLLSRHFNFLNSEMSDVRSNSVQCFGPSPLHKLW